MNLGNSDNPVFSRACSIVQQHEHFLFLPILKRIEDYCFEWLYAKQVLDVLKGNPVVPPFEPSVREVAQTLGDGEKVLSLNQKSPEAHELMVEPVFQAMLYKYGMKGHRGRRAMSVSLGLMDENRTSTSIIYEEDSEKSVVFGVGAMLDEPNFEYFATPCVFVSEILSEGKQRMGWTLPLFFRQTEYIGVLCFVPLQDGFEEWMDPFKNAGSLFCEQKNAELWKAIPVADDYRPTERYKRGLPNGLRRLLALEELSDLAYYAMTSKEVSSVIARDMMEVVSDAFWKQHARGVMHELGNTLSDPRVYLEPVRNSLNRSFRKLSSLKQKHLSSLDAASLSDLDYCLGELDASLDSITGFETRLERMQFKLNWYYQLVDPRRNAQEECEQTLQEILEKACDEIVRKSFEKGDGLFELEELEKEGWKLVFCAPKSFMEFCFEALLNNAFFHRKAGTTVSLSAEYRADRNELVLRWENEIEPDKAQKVQERLEDAQHSHGLRISKMIAEETLGGTLQTEVFENRIVNCLQLRQRSVNKKCFFQLSDWTQSNL